MDSPVIKTSVETQTLQYQEKLKNFNLAESKLKLCSEIVLLSNLRNQKEEILEKNKKNNEIVSHQQVEVCNLYSTYMEKDRSIRINYSSLIKNFNKNIKFKWRHTLNKYTTGIYKKYTKLSYNPYVNELDKEIQNYNTFIKQDSCDAGLYINVLHLFEKNDVGKKYFSLGGLITITKKISIKDKEDEVAVAARIAEHNRLDAAKLAGDSKALREAQREVRRTRKGSTIKTIYEKGCNNLKEFLIANETEFKFIKNFVDTKKDLFLKQMETNETKYNLLMEELSQHIENIRSLQDKKNLLETNKRSCKDEIKAAEIHVDIVKISVDIKNIEKIIKNLTDEQLKYSDRWNILPKGSYEFFTELTNMIIKINEHIIKLYDIIDSFPKFIEELKEFKKLQYNEAHEFVTKFEKITYIKIEIVDRWYQSPQLTNELLSIEEVKELFEYPSIEISEELISRYIHGNPYKSIFIIFEDLKEYVDEKVIIQLKNDLNYMTDEQNIIYYYKYNHLKNIMESKLQAEIKTNTNINNIIKSENNIKIFKKEFVLNQELYNEITAKIEYENAKKELESFKQSI